MDKTKKMILKVLTACILLFSIETVKAQIVGELEFCDIEYEYKQGKDSITLYFNLIEKIVDKKIKNITDSAFNELTKSFKIIEDKSDITSRGEFEKVKSVQQISSEYTFSVLVDLSIPKEGKEKIYNAVAQLIEATPDSCVYLSFFGDSVTSSTLVTKNNYKEFKEKFNIEAQNKYFYSGLYSKLIEFSDRKCSLESKIKIEENYRKNEAISEKAKKQRDKNILFIFTEGDMYPTNEEGRLSFFNFIDYYDMIGSDTTIVAPKIYALYYSTGKKENENVKELLKAVCNPKDKDRKNISWLQGMYSPTDNMETIISKFMEVVNELKYDYSFKYKVGDSRSYTGEVKFYCFNEKNDTIGYKRMSVGSPESPWPVRVEDSTGMAKKYLYALLISLIAIAIVFVVTKVIIPYVRSKSFAIKYYKKYVAEANVSRRVCHYCRQEIEPGQSVVTRCKHIMHVSCWKQNGYRCVEYGQNCKTGIQSHIEWNELFSLSSLKDCYPAISGIIAGFISWCLYELIDAEFFNSISESIVKLCYNNQDGIYNLLINKTSSFLIIGLLLGFFLSLIFRYNDEYKNKDFKVWAKIFGLSVLTGMIGVVAFACGAILLCCLMSIIGTTYLPWYCSLPAYILFSISVSLALSIKSTIPLKSALLGGLCSALIGFVVLYYSSQFNESHAWMNMLLNFVIYGGGLGASLVTIRILAEKYFLVIQNGVRAGQRIPIHKWMNATGGGNKVTIGMGSDCEIQMNWEKSNKLSDEHVQLYVDYDKQLPMLNPLASGVVLNARVELPVRKPTVLSNGDIFKVGDTIFLYQETE